MRDFFWGEFDLAEISGSETIKDLAKKSYEKYKDDIVALTDLVMVINHKSWVWHDFHRDNLSELYANLYYEYYEKAINYLEKKDDQDDLTYFIRTLD